MSIKKSLRISMILLSSIPVIVMAVLSNIVASNKYVELNKETLKYTADTYREGFEASINTLASRTGILAANMYLQSFLAEKVNSPAVNLTSSSYYKTIEELFNQENYATEDSVSYYLYDIDGYYVLGTGTTTGDWAEYMDRSVSEITETVVYADTAFGDSDTTIDIITPVFLKGMVIGLIRTNVSRPYFNAFIPENGEVFILDEDNHFLFNHNEVGGDDYLMKTLSEIRRDNMKQERYGTIIRNSGSEFLYSYSMFDSLDWVFILRADRSAYRTIMSSTPLLLTVFLLILLLIALRVSTTLTKRYTDPIMELNACMMEAAWGNYEVSCNIKSKNEFGQLSQCFNEMMRIISDTNIKQLNTQKQLEANEAQLIEHNRHVERLAYTDALTKLFNRLAFMKFSQNLLEENSHADKLHAVLFIDLDDFKNVNDTLGHDYGDELLIQVAKQLEACVNDKDILARTGGDEFLIFKNLPDSKAQVEETARNLVNITNHPFDIKGETVHVSMSVGISYYPENGQTLTDLIKTADIAMYEAKTAGKNVYRVFDRAMESDINERSEMINVLQTAIDNHELYLVYQPQEDVRTGKITGYEALMRMNSSIRGEVPPSEFIPVAEECGMIETLGDWALFEACSFNRRLLHEGYEPVTVSVNVSTAQLTGDHIIETLTQVKEETGMPLHYLELEITESILMHNFEHNLELIGKMKDMGVKIALDDFGTGYSSFNYLTQIPIDTLKIDKTFINGITHKEKDRYIADTIINLAHKMEIRVIAEGVENLEQFSILQEQMCDILQGYYFSKPISEDKLISLLGKNQD